jgi:hypothetical protein
LAAQRCEISRSYIRHLRKLIKDPLSIDAVDERSEASRVRLLLTEADTVGELKEGEILHVPNVPQAMQAKPAEAGLVKLAPAFYAGSGLALKH